MSASKKVIITGAQGFVGQELSRLLVKNGYTVSGWVRDAKSAPQIAGVEWVSLGDFTKLELPEIEAAMKKSGARAVIHLAARVHQMKETGSQPIDLYREMNRDFTLSLHRAAENCGIEKFIFLSTVKVMGESSERALTEDDRPEPTDPYGISKLEAEETLRARFSNQALKTYIFRIPLVYGAGAKGNFKLLMKAIRRGLWFPFGSIKNHRSMLYVENLCSAIFTALDKPGVSSGTYFITDGSDWSTRELVESIGKVAGRSRVHFPFPVFLLVLFATLLGKKSFSDRLTKSFYFSGDRFRKDFGWEPPVSALEGLKKSL